ADGKRIISGRPELIREVCEGALKRLQTDVIDLYYLHRRDFSVPIEDSVGELSRLVEEGKIRTIGLSEVSADTLRRAHAVHPVSALQTEYSLWSRNAEIAVLEECRKLGTAFVAFSPLARAIRAVKLTDPQTPLEGKHIRKHLPRLSSADYPRNLARLDDHRSIAEEVGCSMARLALAWVLH